MLTFISGKRGKSKAQVELSITTMWNGVVIHVWEVVKGQKKITHTFYPDKEFLEQMVSQAGASVQHIEEELQNMAKEKQRAT